MESSPSFKQKCLNVIYGVNSPLFNKLISIINQGPINTETQINIENFLTFAPALHSQKQGE